MYGSPKFAHLIQHTTTNILPQRDYLKKIVLLDFSGVCQIVVHGLKTLHLIHNGVTIQTLSHAQQL